MFICLSLFHSMPYPPNSCWFQNDENLYFLLVYVMNFTCALFPIVMRINTNFRYVTCVPSDVRLYSTLCSFSTVCLVVVRWYWRSGWYTPSLYSWCVWRNNGIYITYMCVCSFNQTHICSIFLFFLFTSVEVIFTSLHFSNFNNHIGAAEQLYQLLIISYFDFHSFEFIFVN